MGSKIFENIIKERLEEQAGGTVESGAAVLEEVDEGKERSESELEKIKLLALLPEELRDKSIRENFPIEHVQKIIEFREKKGYKTVIGFHVSPLDLKIGDFLRPGANSDDEIFFTTNLDNLYLGKTPRFIYAIECSETLMKVADASLDWYKLKGENRIIDKIKMTPEAIEALGAGFAECDYS